MALYLSSLQACYSLHSIIHNPPASLFPGVVWHTLRPPPPTFEGISLDGKAFEGQVYRGVLKTLECIHDLSRYF